MRRTDTANQRRSNAAYQQANPLLPVARSKQRQRAFDAATEYFSKYSTPLTRTLRDVFGVEFFARAALWLDPLAPFRNASGIIGYENRFRQKDGFKHIGTVFWTTDYVNRNNQQSDDPHPLDPPAIVEESSVEHDPVVNDNATAWNSYMWDSTNSSRSWEDSYASDERYDIDIPSFGTMRLHRVKSEDYITPNTIFRTVDEETHYSRDNYLFFERGVFTDRLSIDGSCTSPSGAIFVDDIETFALDFMNDNVSSVLPGALASKRSFNLAYQIAELKDVPGLLRDIGNLQHLLQSYIKNPTLKLSELDKDVASLNLAWEFGVKSLVSAAKGLIDLPTKATKRLNYLIKRNGKVSTGRSKRTWSKYEFDQGLPTFEFKLPFWIEVTDEEVKRDVSIELRCVVNQTIQFPQLAVPSITDKNYRKLIGLNPDNVQDYYNLIPFSWLFDWFGGLGDYVKIMDAIHSDDQLINYGFLTIVIDEVLTHKANLRVKSTYDRYRANPTVGEDSIHEEHTESVRDYPYLKTYTRRYQQRVDIGSLEGVKSFGFFQTNLSDFQSKILGSLFSQRA